MAENNVVRELLVRLGVVTDAETDIKKFDKAIDGVKAGMRSAGEYAGQAKQQVALLVGQVVAVGAAAATAVGGLVYLSDETATYALNVERQAAAMGMTTDVYQELRGTFERFGVDQRDVADLFAQISQQATAAQGGAKGIEQAFNTLGIASADLKGKDPEGILLAIADGAARTKDPVARLSALSSLLGEDLTKKLAPLLMQGSEGIAQFRQEIRDLGGVMDADGIAKAAEYKDAVGDLKVLITGLTHEIGVMLLPVLTQLAKRMQKWIQETRKSPARLRALGVALLFAATGAGALFTALAAFRAGSAAYYGIMALASLVPVIQGLGTVLTFAAGGAGILGTLGTALASLGAPEIVAIFAAVVVTLAELAAAVAAVAALFAFWYFVLEDVFMFINGSGDTVLGDLVARLQEAGGSFAALGTVIRQAGDSIKAVISILGSLETIAGQAIVAALGRAQAAIYGVGSALVSTFGPAAVSMMNLILSPFVQLEALLARIQPTLSSVASSLAITSASGVFGSSLASAGATAGGVSSKSFDSHDSTSISISTPNPVAAGAAVSGALQKQSAKKNRTTKQSIGGGEV